MGTIASGTVALCNRIVNLFNRMGQTYAQPKICPTTLIHVCKFGAKKLSNGLARGLVKKIFVGRRSAQIQPNQWFGLQ